MDKPFSVKVKKSYNIKKHNIKLSDILNGLPYNTRKIILYRENKEEDISSLILVDASEHLLKIIETNLKILSPHIIEYIGFDEWDKNQLVLNTDIKKIAVEDGYLFSKELNDKVPESVRNVYNLSEIIDKPEYTLLSGVKINYIEPQI